MTDISVTPANVVASTGAQKKTLLAGGTITAGMAVYFDSSVTPPTVKAADADATALTADAKGIALNGGSVGQPITVQTGGRINPGGTVVVGEIYVVSGAAGGIAPEGDLAAGDWVTVLGIGVTAALIDLNIHASGVQVPAP